MLASSIIEASLTRRLAKDSDFRRITAKSCNIVLYPLQGKALVKEANITRSQWDFRRAREAKYYYRSQHRLFVKKIDAHTIGAIIGCNYDNIFIRREA